MADDNGEAARLERDRAERPSRIWAVGDGAPWWCSVDILQGHSTEFFVSAARPTLEAMGVQVRVWPLRNENVAERLLSGEEHLDADYLIVSCHGLEGQLLYNPAAHRDPDFRAGYTVDELRPMLSPGERPVLSIGCFSGDGGLPGAFLDAGATAFVAPHGAPFTYSASVFISNVFFLMTHHVELAEAVERSRLLEEEFHRWRIHTAM